MKGEGKFVQPLPGGKKVWRAKKFSSGKSANQT